MIPRKLFKLSKHVHLTSCAGLLAVTLLLILTICSTGKAQFQSLRLADSTEQELVKVTSLFSTTAAEPGKTYRGATVATIAKGWHINSAKPYQSFLIAAKLELDTIPGIIPSNLEYPEASDVSLMGDAMSVYSHKAVMMFDVSINTSTAAGVYILPIRFTYQPCNDRECRSPQTVDVGLKITVGSGGVPDNNDLFAVTTTVPTPKEPPAQSAAQDNDFQKLIDRYGFWGYIIALGLAFVTGLLLSFSPCTYPMIPITVSIFAGQERSMVKGFMHSLLYVGSMAAVYGIMGLVVASIGGVFGAWLANPAVVIGIAVIFVIFSLSMFGLYELQVPSALRQRMGTKSVSNGIGGSILLGIIAALVVSPCVGPFVAGILVYVATNGSPIVGFLVLFVFALGLGTLYIIIGTFSSAINALPNSGMWMESVKKFFGFVLLLMAIYFLRTILPTSVTAIATGLLLIAFGVFGGGFDRLTAEAKFFPRLKKFLGVLALLIGLYLLLGSMITSGFILPPASEWLPGVGSSTSSVESTPIAWGTDLETGLAEAGKSGKPVLIDTWATWCANCRVLDKKTFHDPQVVEEARRFVPIKVQLETSTSPVTKDFMTRFGLKYYSLPTTLLLDASGKVERIMQGVVSPQEMITEMRKIR